MAKKQQSPSAPIYQLKITLRDAKPPIWRRVLVPSDYTLAQLHAVIQTAMGWDNSHMHQFILGRDRGTIYASDPRFELEGGYWTDVPVLKEALQKIGFDMKLLSRLDLVEPDILDERKITLGKVVSVEKGKFAYECDFGDSWEHEILLEKIAAPEEGVTYPVCIDGRRACPPDDSGGVWGYMAMLDALKNPDDPENEEVQDWIGEDFDPEAFDASQVTPMFKHMDQIMKWW